MDEVCDSLRTAQWVARDATMSNSLGVHGTHGRRRRRVKDCRMAVWKKDGRK